MGRNATHQPKKRILMPMVVAISVFLLLYFGGAIHDGARRYSRALDISRNQAHTVVGREGYEYIFEPNTQIFIDKILPTNEHIIITHIVFSDYLPFDLISGCRFLDQDICMWMRLNILYHHDPKPRIHQLFLYASISALLIGSVFYLLLNKNFITP
jgi:hypothetical protein